MSVYEHTSLSLGQGLARQPVFRILVIAFMVIAVIPVSILVWHVNRVAWEDAWRQITEKHQLLATNLGSPLAIYVNDHRAFLSHLSGRLEAPAAAGERTHLLQSAFKDLLGFRSLTLLSVDGSIEAFAHRDSVVISDAESFHKEACFTHTRDTAKPALSDLKLSPFTGDPTVIVSSPVFGTDGAVAAVLLGELSMARIETLRRSINFGDRGHSAIVDARGRVIAHPNAEWARQMRDLSHLDIVKRMMNGGSGVIEFYSPFIEEDMVAGYATVPELGWGIMVPQPKQEIVAQVKSLLISQYAWSIVGMVVALILAVPLARWITKPINRLASDAEEVSRAAFSGAVPSVPHGAPFEVRKLAVAMRGLLFSLRHSRDEVSILNQSLQSRVSQQTKALMHANARLEEIALTDELTSLPNRRHFEQRLRKIVQEAQRRITTGALLYVDLDQFKIINDTCGHLAGDALLRDLVALMQAQVRQDDFVARIGGDEFALLLSRCDFETASHVAEKLREAIDKFPFIWDKNRFRVTASIGVVLIDEHSVSETDVLRIADRCCYQAKDSGRNHVYLYRQEDDSLERRRGDTQWITRLNEAVTSDRLTLHAQQIYPVYQDGMGRHYELLLRIIGEDGSLIPPGAFLPAAERYNFMPEIDRWVVNAALEWHQQHALRLPPRSSCYINLSASSLGDERFGDYLLARLVETDVDPRRLCFEVTESAALHNFSQAASLMTRLRQVGARFALDDFGTGMCSFTYLRDLPIDVIKIDGSFVSRMADNATNRAVVRSIVDVAHALGLVTVAEGVENETILEDVKELQVDYVQGFHLSRPESLLDVVDQLPLLDDSRAGEVVYGGD